MHDFPRGKIVPSDPKAQQTEFFKNMTGQRSIRCGCIRLLCKILASGCSVRIGVMNHDKYFFINNDRI